MVVISPVCAGTERHWSIKGKTGSPHVEGGALEGRFEGLSCCRQSVRDGEMSLRPVFVLHNWSQVLVHIIHSQHWHLQEREPKLKWQHIALRCLEWLCWRKALRGQPECFGQSAGWFQSRHRPRQMDWWSAPLPTECKLNYAFMTKSKEDLFFFKNMNVSYTLSQPA